MPDNLTDGGSPTQAPEHGAPTTVSNTEATVSKDQADTKEKMEVIARLVGGIAHDFNNLLAVVLLHSDLLLKAPIDEATIRRRGRDIKAATERAAALTRQLLAFGGRQLMHKKSLDLNEEIDKSLGTISRKLGPEIKLTTNLGHNLGAINADPIHLEQAIANIVANAKEAMPSGGQLFITTEPFEADAGGLTLMPGRYIKLTITDTGRGIDPETKRRVFEPFFTTKAQGKGYGLGLSVAYGILKQFSGEIIINSEPVGGTSVELYFPRSAYALPEAERELPSGTETILLVEDEDLVRRAAAEILEMCGYTVLEAESGADALEISAECDEPIALLLTDVIMQGMNGPALAEAIAATRPEMPVLFMSGFTDADVASRGLLKKGAPMIEKPFTTEKLARRVRKILDEGMGPTG